MSIRSEELSLPSLRGGVSFSIRPLHFGGFKAVGRAEAAGSASVDIMDTMVYETLKREFPDLAASELDGMEMDDMMALIEVVTAANEGLQGKDFTPSTSGDS